MTTPDWIELATKHGAKFEEKPGEWHASAHVRGRQPALFTVVGKTQLEAAEMFCRYIRLDVPKERPRT